MSQLKTNSIANVAGTASTDVLNVINGSAKAWVSYNSIAQTVKASYNVSSVTYNTTGQFTVNFTNAFANTNYGMAGTSTPVNTIGTGRGGSDLTTTSAIIYVGYFGGSSFTAANSAYNFVAFYNS